MGPEDIDKLSPDVIEKIVSGRVVNSRCNCCTHPDREAIDKLCITSNFSTRDIAKLFGVSHNSVHNHKTNHLNYETAAIRAIIVREAELLGQDIEDGIRGELSRKVFLETIIQRAQEALVSNELPVSANDAMKALDMLQTKEQEAFTLQLQKLNAQFEAFQSAMKEMVDPDLWFKIVQRAEEITLGIPKYVEASVEEVVDAEVDEKNLLYFPPKDDEV